MILSYKVPKGLKYNNLVNKTKKEADLQMRRTNWWLPVAGGVGGERSNRWVRSDKFTLLGIK